MHASGAQSSELAWLRACAMTTKFLDYKICTFKILIVVALPKKNSVFGQFSSRPPRPTPLKSCKPGRHGQKSDQLIWPKVPLRGRKRSLRKREQKARCTGATWGCTGANLVCTGASDFWETLGPSGPKTFCTPARQLSVICTKLTSVHGALVCNSKVQILFLLSSRSLWLALAPWICS